MVYTIIETFGGNVGIGTRDPGSNRLKVYGGTSKFGDVTVSSLSAGGTSDAHPPSGIIIMWYGAYNNLPTGWKLCDGTNDTPDLRSKFILGWGTTYSVGQSGGAENYAFTSNEITPHSHGATLSSATNHSHTVTPTAHTHPVVTTAHNHSTSGGGHDHQGNSNQTSHTHNTNQSVPHSHRNKINDSRNATIQPGYYNVNSTWASWTSHGNVSDNNFQNIGTRNGGDHAHGQVGNGGGHTHASNNVLWNHNHSQVQSPTGGHTHTSGTAAAIQHSHNTSASGDHTHTYNLNPAGSATAFGIIPEYHALVFIMKE